jgi:hypothetical protein
MQPTAIIVTALLAILACAACDSSSSKLPLTASPPAGYQPFIRTGTTIRLNLPTPEAKASVLYKDPVQGEKWADGKVHFPDIGQNDVRMRIGLAASVAEWDTETCKGLLYYFRPGVGRPQSRAKAETTVVASPPPSS